MLTKPYGDYYTLYEDGNVWSNKCNKFLTPVKHNQGYLCVTLKVNGTLKKLLVHRLIAEAFIPNPECKRTVNHKDGNKHNNNVSNLEWCTHSENHAHAFRTHLRENPTGFELGTNRLSAEDVRYIRTFCKKGDPEFGYYPLANRFDVSVPTIYKIVRHQSYKSVI